MFLLIAQWAIMITGLVILGGMVWFVSRPVPEPPEIVTIEERPVDGAALATLKPEEDQTYIKQMDIVWHAVTRFNCEAAIPGLWEFFNETYNRQFDDWQEMKWRKISRKFLQDTLKAYEFNPATGGPVLVIKQPTADGYIENHYILMPSNSDEGVGRRFVLVSDLYANWQQKPASVVILNKAIPAVSPPLTKQRAAELDDNRIIPFPASQLNGALT